MTAAAQQLPNLKRFGNSAVEWICARSPVVARLLWPLVSHESAFVHRYLDGLKGIEIGAAAHNDFRLDAINVDRYSAMDTIYKEEERRLSGRKRRVDLVAPGDELPFKDDAVDFVFASHVLEHIADPIRALKEWLRVARKYVVVIVPHRDRTFDRDRDLTSVDELVERHGRDLESDEDTHWSVWTLESFLDMCDRIGFTVVDSQDPDDKVGNGFAVVLDAAARS